jgi:hypothetical protein
MDSLVYLLSHFYQEALALQLFLIGLFGAILFGIAFYHRKKHKYFKNQIPSWVVQNYLENVLSNTEALQSDLLGNKDAAAQLRKSLENAAQNVQSGGPQVSPGHLSAGYQGQGGEPSLNPQPAQAQASADSLTLRHQNHVGDSAGDQASLAQINALKNELQGKESKLAELNQKLSDLQKEKSSLEIKAASGGGGAESGVDQGEIDKLKKQIEELQARLGEYEIIEDDLADLKHLQQENEKLKSTIESLKKGGSLEEAESEREVKESEEDFDQLVDQVEQNLAEKDQVKVMDSQDIAADSSDQNSNQETPEAPETQAGQEPSTPKPSTPEPDAPAQENMTTETGDDSNAQSADSSEVPKSEQGSDDDETPKQNKEKDNLLSEFEAMLDS